MKKSLSILIIPVVLAVGGWTIFKPSAPQEQPPTTPSSNRQEAGETEEQVAQQQQEDINPVSLQALMQEDFNGNNLELGRVLSRNNVYTRHHITYESGDLTISGIMNIPNQTPPEGGFPVLFLNHGYIDPAVYTNGRGLKREQNYLARQGYAVLHSDYRNHAQSDNDPENSENLRLGYVRDVINAVRAVQNSDVAELSKERFGMLGHSMGGGITQSVMAVKPDLIDAAVLYAPVSSDAVDNYNRWQSDDEEVVAKVESTYGTPEENPVFWENRSPRTFFDRVDIPVKIFHGTADESCDLAWSRETRDLLNEVGKDVELVEFEGGKHEFGRHYTSFMEQTAEFFDNEV